MNPMKKYRCPIEISLDVLGGKWKILILWYLAQKTLRFAELKRSISGITHKMLAQQLRELEADELISRKVYPEVPPRVEYTVTDYGETLIPIVKSLCDWGNGHRVRHGIELVDAISPQVMVS